MYPTVGWKLKFNLPQVDFQPKWVSQCRHGTHHPELKAITNHLGRIVSRNIWFHRKSLASSLLFLFGCWETHSIMHDPLVGRLQGRCRVLSSIHWTSQVSRQNLLVTNTGTAPNDLTITEGRRTPPCMEHSGSALEWFDHLKILWSTPECSIHGGPSQDLLILKLRWIMRRPRLKELWQEMLGGHLNLEGSRTSFLIDRRTEWAAVCQSKNMIRIQVLNIITHNSKHRWRRTFGEHFLFFQNEHKKVGSTLEHFKYV